MAAFALRDVYMDALWQNASMWGSWPIATQNIELGGYGTTSGHTFQVLGNIRGTQFGIEMDPVQVEQPPAALRLASTQLTTRFFEYRDEAWVEVPDVNVSFESDTAVSYESKAGTAFVAVFDALSHFTVGQDGDTRGYLTEIWPKLKASGAWSSHYALVADVYYAVAGIFGGGTAKDVAFRFSASRGAEIADLLNGSITTKLTAEDVYGAESTWSTYDPAAPAAIGYGLWSFDSHGHPKPLGVPS